MSVFLDASAIIGILGREADSEALRARLDACEGGILVSGMTLFEATIGLAQKYRKPNGRPTAAQIARARHAVREFLAAANAKEVAIDGAIGDRAIEASMRYGKVVGHPAELNFGDCFAYACAKSTGAPLLYKGDDFSKTDILTA